MSDVIDKLIFQLGGDLKDLNVAYAQAEAGAQKTGTAIKANLGTGFKEAAAAAQTHTADLKKAMGEVDTAVKSTHGSVSQATREFRALFDELSSGRTRQTPGTLAIIATRVFGISGATLAWGAAIAAIPVAFAVATVQVENSLARMRQALKLTGDASGLTLGGSAQIAALIAQQAGVSMLRARGIEAGLLSSFVPAGSQALAGQTEVQAGRVGIKSADIQKLIKEMYEEPAKAAAELNTEYRLLTVAQTEQVENLQKSGEYQKAGDIVLQAFNERTKEAAEQAGVFSKALSATGTFFGSLWGKLGSIVSGPTDQERLAAMKAELSDAQKAMAAIKAGTFEGAGGGTVRVVRDLATLPAQIAELQAKIAHDAAEAAAKGRAAAADQDLAHARAIDLEVNKQASTLQTYKDELAAVTKELKNTGGEHDKYRASLLVTQKALQDAIANQRTPAQIAAEEADDQRRIAAAPEKQRNTLRAQLAAQRELERNLSNPETAPYARDIYASQMSDAAINNRDINKQASERERQNTNLKVALDKAKAEEALAAAYSKGAAAAEMIKAAEDARTASDKGEIRVSQENAYADALLRTAFATERVATEKKLASDQAALAASPAIGAAGGDPYAITRATQRNEAQAQIQKEFDSAGTMKEVVQAMQDFDRALESIQQRDRQLFINTGNADLSTARQGYGRLSQQYGLTRAGGNEDDVRHLTVAQETYTKVLEQAQKDGVEPGSVAFKTLYQQMLLVNEQTSDLSDAMNKLREEAKQFASDIAGPIKQYLTRGGNPLNTISDIGQNMLDTAVQNHIIDPLQKQLESVFGNLLGAPGTTADGTLASPYYVHVLPDVGGVPGLPGGGGSSEGGIGSVFSQIFSSLGIGGDGINPVTVTPGLDVSQLGTAGAGAASAASSGGFLSSIGDFLASFAGFFDDGGTIAPGQWGIKSGMPEIIQGGTGGVSVMPLMAPSIIAAIGSGTNPGSTAGGGGSGGKGGSITRGGDTFHFHLPSVKNTSDFIASRSQLESMVSKAAARGRRNT